MFVCGPTVYNHSHIGHAKTYVQFDIIARYLRYKKYKLFYIMNITDIDDKIIARAKEQNKDPLHLAKEYENYFYKDMKSLKITSINKFAPATRYINQIVSQVKRLQSRGYAYKTSDGYYFNLAKFKDYGKLSGRTVIQSQDSISRIDESIQKINKGDFCLWKFHKENEPFWDTELGRGRPGWHIEDTAITEKEFGQQYDIHGGARDLIFPHHEAEIAQMESISKKKPFVKYWLHTGFLTVNSQKMSKSLGNFITIQESLKKYSPEQLRLFYSLSHYRSPIDYNEKNLNQAVSNLEKITNFISQLKLSIRKTSPTKKQPNKKKQTKQIETLTKKLLHDFIKYMDDDFNTPKVFASLFSFIAKINKIVSTSKISKNDFKKVNSAILEINKIFCILPSQTTNYKIPKEIIILAEQRLKARKEKNYMLADSLRKIINEKGFQIDDHDGGYIIKK